MSGLFSRIRYPVERRGAERYLRLTLLAFAATVVLTRLFLSFTGYPRLGGGSLHIAHMLWGGLLLFTACLLPLILANRWVYPLTGFLSGVGVGLFIDEVGKFITQTNDYFYPAAAPIIYAFFLLTVLLYLRVRRPDPQDPRTELYRAFDALSEVLDHDLDERERAALEKRLQWVAQQQSHPEMAALARSLLEFVVVDAVVVPSEGPTFAERLWHQVRVIEDRYVCPARLKLALIAGLGFLGIPAIVAPVSLLLAAWTRSVDPTALEGIVMAAANGSAGSPLGWAWARLLLSGVAGFPLLVAAVFFLIRWNHLGAELAYFGLMGYLAVVNLLVFYFDQFQAIIGAMLQFILLRAVIYYRQRYLSNRPISKEPEIGLRAED